MNKRTHSIAGDVMQKIKRGEVRMKPRFYFSILSILIVFAVLAAGLAVSYLSSILFYWIRIETSATMAYGARRNLNEAIAAFPWWVVAVAASLVFLAVILVRKHGTMYRHKASTVALFVIAFSLIVGLILYSLGIGGLGDSRHNNQGSGRRGQSLRQNQ